MTQEFLQDAVVEDLQDLFKGYRLKNSLGVEREINIFPYDTPIREGDDEAVDQEAPPESGPPEPQAAGEDTKKEGPEAPKPAALEEK